ncbi:MAG: DUF2610 domain-containing protein [Ardenticatenaceae bacterium]|nr:DUF2610 domain-containing protein [Ardenticatenaceae bacterium]
MKRFTVPCNFGHTTAPFHIYIGEAGPRRHPLYYQSVWLREERGGEIPTEVWDSFEVLWQLALKHDVHFEKMCIHSLGNANEIEKKYRGRIDPISDAEKDGFRSFADDPNLEDVKMARKIGNIDNKMALLQGKNIIDYLRKVQ